MRAITINEPYASLVIGGHKFLETRGRRTHVRGPVAVHASKRTMDEEGKKLAEKYGVTPQYGKVLGTAYLCGCGEVLDDQASEISWTMHTGISGKESDHERFNGLIERVSMKKEKELGWLGKGRFAWAMDVLDKFENPVPAKGQQGFWKWDGK